MRGHLWAVKGAHLGTLFLAVKYAIGERTSFGTEEQLEHTLLLLISRENRTAHTVLHPYIGEMHTQA